MKHGGFQHHALIYAGVDEYLAGTLPFLRGALQAGEPLLVAVGAAQTRWLEGELNGDETRVRFLPMEEVGRNPALIISLWRDFVDENSGRSVRGIGEAVWAGRSPAALEEAHRQEALLDRVFRDDPDFSLLCPYDASLLPEQALERAAHAHSEVVRDGRAVASTEFDPGVDCFAGELPPVVGRAEAFNFGVAELAAVRERVAAAAKQADLDPRGVADLVTAASELAANSVMHGGGAGTLRVWRQDGSLLTEVEDRGRIEDPLVGRLRPGFTQEGGRGLWLANQLCELVQIRSDDQGTVVRLHVPVPDRADGSQAPPAATDPRAETNGHSQAEPSNA
jgi:anti-sigma regulatory factor (Ser/Thr protein kinase)